MTDVHRVYPGTPLLVSTRVYTPTPSEKPKKYNRESEGELLQESRLAVSERMKG